LRGHGTSTWGLTIISGGFIATIVAIGFLYEVDPFGVSFLILGYLGMIFGYVIYRIGVRMKPKNTEIWGYRMLEEGIWMWEEATHTHGACPACTKFVDPVHVKWESPSEFRCDQCNELIKVRLERLSS
jgi:hypothetical protein